MSNETFIKSKMFSDILEWDYNSQFAMNIVSKFSIEYLANHIQEENHKVSLSAKPDEDFKILGISNALGMFDAYVKKGKEFNQKYKKVKQGWIAYNPYRINVGSIGIKAENIENDFISPAYVVFSCKETLLPEFLLFVLKSEFGNQEIRNNTTGSVRQILNYDKLCNIRIPILPIDEQKAMMKTYKDLQDEIERLQEALHTHTHNASQDILYKELTIDFQKKTDDITMDTYLKFAAFSAIVNWDTKMIDETNISCLNSARYKNVKLKSLATVNPRTAIPKDLDITFVPMENISEVYGELKSERYKNSNEAKGYTKFKENDIAWAKITPCMENGKSFIANELKNGYGIGTTELHIVRNNDDEVLDTRYLFYILRSNMVRENAVDFFTGTAGQKRVKKEFLENLLIPLPSIEKQREIAQKIDDEIKNAKETELKIKHIEEEKSRLISAII